LRVLNLNHNNKRLLEILGFISCIIYLMIVFYYNDIEYYTIISHFLFVCAAINLGFFDFKNKYLSAITVYALPTEIFTLIGQQIGMIIEISTGIITPLVFAIVSINNWIIHGVPFIMGIYIARNTERELTDWKLFELYLIIYILWCYILDFRYTDTLLIFQFQIYLLSAVIWSTIFFYYYRKAKLQH